MSAFSFDTSGTVGPMPSGYDDPGNRRGFWSFPRARYTWSDLSPFVQGYVEALFASVCHDMRKPDDAFFAFSDLDPSALALILRDCEAFLMLYPPSEEYARSPHDVNDGTYLWKDRQNGLYPEGFPPLQPYLSDEGKVCLRHAYPLYTHRYQC